MLVAFGLSILGACCMCNLWLSDSSAQTPAKEVAMRQDDQPTYWTDDLPFTFAGSATARAAEVSCLNSMTISIG